MSHDEVFTAICFAVLATVCGCFLIGVALLNNERKSFHNEAIKRNYAEWVNDGEGNPVFTWKEPAQ